MLRHVRVDFLLLGDPMGPFDDPASSDRRIHQAHGAGGAVALKIFYRDDPNLGWQVRLDAGYFFPVVRGSVHA